MKYLALLSGGKDSCYNLVHCAQNGHELVAAASLGPEPGKEELDSYLYQTVGQDAIEFVARALDVPLYRRIIIGNAVEQGSEYGGRKPNNAGGIAGDETEDLFELLSTVKTHHPDVKGVSVGAILSNYQRVRVEHVCRRLGLTSLCYLWQRDQSELLAEMIEAGMEAILIKVAGIGLTKSHLGKTLAQMQGTLSKLNTLYGSHVCGEGGEYETLTLDCPLFKHRINLTDTETVIHSDNDFATVAYLRVKGAELEPKVIANNQVASIPPLLEERYQAVKDSVAESHDNVASNDVPSLHNELYSRHITLPGSLSQRKDAWIVVSNVQVDLLTRGDLTIEEEVTQCFKILAEHLGSHGADLSQCTMINILISSMDLFLPVNAIYSTFFGTSPPARACVCVDLPEGVRVKLECIAYAERFPQDRQALHVQGLSYWAPANIGPYSQAITVGERVFISGQIGLIPSQLALPTPRSLPTEVALASQHVERITNALKENTGGGWEGYTQSAIYWLTEPSDLIHIKQSHLALESLQYPTLFVVVKELPKDALVEKQVILHTGRCPVVDDYDGESTLQSCTPSYNSKKSDDENGRSLLWEMTMFEEDNSACATIFVKGDFDQGHVTDLREMVSSMTQVVDNSLSIRLFYRSNRNISVDKLQRYIFGEGILPITTIPCRSISSQDTDDWDLAFLIITASSSHASQQS